MGWAHAAVAMEEVLGLVRGFVDVLVLAGGRTSSGAAATWSSDEVKKALRWALFFEEVSSDSSLNCSSAPAFRRPKPIMSSPSRGGSHTSDFRIPYSLCRLCRLCTCRICAINVIGSTNQLVRDISLELLNCACTVFRFSRTCVNQDITRILQENSMQPSLSSLQVRSFRRCMSKTIQYMC